MTSSTALGWEASRSVEKMRVAWRRETKQGGWPWGVWVTQPHAGRRGVRWQLHSCCHGNSSPGRREARRTGLLVLGGA